MQRTFKYRLYPNRQQRETLAAQLDLCRELYNAALQERIASYKTTRKGVTWLQQQAQLPAIKEVRPEFKSVHAHTLQAELIRLHRSFQNFFRRVKKNESPGFPRLKGRNRFNSLVFTPTGAVLQMLAYKAESAGRQLFAGDPRGTSQTCVCGAKVPKRLSDRKHVCTACELMASRDHVSAQVILERARTVPLSANVGEVM